MGTGDDIGKWRATNCTPKKCPEYERCQKLHPSGDYASVCMEMDKKSDEMGY